MSASSGLPVSSVIEQAMRVAAVAHREMRRKASDVPYIAHPASVALILSQAGFHDENILAAALLHDVVEDTEVTFDDLSRQFSPAVVDHVRALTEEKRDGEGNKRPWEDRKRDHLEHLKQSSLGARAIALADKLHNLQSILVEMEQQGMGVWAQFNALPDRALWYYRSMLAACDQGEPELRGLADSCRTLIDRVEAETSRQP
jgi:guanosine-3',5'-bis(diphosphate) 3'-pyrophosphohydrolase